MNDLGKEILKGNLVIMPTDTTYGIVCDATNDEAVKKVFRAKERDFSKPLIILVSDINMLEEYTEDISPLTKQVISKYWPGPLSILFLKSPKISDLVTASSPYVAIRMPDDSNLINLIKKINRPIVATSANISGSEIITDVKTIEKELLAKIDYIVDGGIITSSPSTLIKVDDKIQILRRGILASQIQKDFKEKVLD